MGRPFMRLLRVYAFLRLGCEVAVAALFRACSNARLARVPALPGAWLGWLPFPSQSGLTAPPCLRPFCSVVFLLAEDAKGLLLAHPCRCQCPGGCGGCCSLAPSALLAAGGRCRFIWLPRGPRSQPGCPRVVAPSNPQVRRAAAFNAERARVRRVAVMSGPPPPPVSALSRRPACVLLLCLLAPGTFGL
jgi:hypothetical protein